MHIIHHRNTQSVELNCQKFHQLFVYMCVVHYSNLRKMCIVLIFAKIVNKIRINNTLFIESMFFYLFYQYLPLASLKISFDSFIKV